MKLSDFITSGAACGIMNTRPIQSGVRQMRDWHGRGLIRLIGDAILVNDNDYWSECFILTDAGRVECGLEPIDKPKPTERTLFD